MVRASQGIGPLHRTALLAGAVLLVALSCLFTPAHGQPARRTGGPAKLDDVNIYLVLRDGNRLIGQLAGFDKNVIRVRDQQGKIQSAQWDQFLPQGCYFLQKRLTDPNSPEVQFRLGHYCWANNLRDFAYEHFTAARQLDPAYAERIKQVVTGQYKGPVQLAVSLIDPRELDELERLERSGPLTDDHAAVRPKTVVKYQPFSAQVQARAVEQIREFGQQVNEKLGTRLRTFETERFIIFTTWPANEDRPVGQMFETVYRRLAAQFNIPAGENIYLGKLPVFCWDSHEQFARFAREIHNLEVRKTTMAYVWASTSGAQQMNMFRYPNRILLEKIVAHECVHTFVNRYKSNIPLEMWLNEGLAEVMAGALVPRSRTLERARAVVATNARSIDIAALLNAGYAQLNAGDYPVATTLVDYLLRRDPTRFLDMVDRIKAGTATEAALKEAYNLDYPSLAAVWRRWVVADFPDRPR